jgi:phosphatidylserine/phosphatidylglycerophosphate/cardiolipin synthase-like enzyme
MDREFQEAVANLVREVLPETLDRLATRLSANGVSPESIRMWSLELPQKVQREALGNFTKSWRGLDGALSPQAVLASLASHRFIEERKTRAEICWSGPTDSLQGLRTTSAAYGDLMSSANHSVLILTFSIGEVESLRTSLEAAIGRGVSVRIILEDFDVFSQESRSEKILHFGPVVVQKAKIFVWPVGNRRAFEGRIYGCMHVKCLVIDDEAMLLTSANWSGAAMQDNMELGVALRDRELVGRVVDHFNWLLTSGVLAPHVS